MDMPTLSLLGDCVDTGPPTSVSSTVGAAVIGVGATGGNPIVVGDNVGKKVGSSVAAAGGRASVVGAGVSPPESAVVGKLVGVNVGTSVSVMTGGSVGIG